MTAKAMFEKLGWKIINAEDDDTIYYKKVKGQAVYYLEFHLDFASYYTYGVAKDHEINNSLNVDEHLAITQQLKELGWLDG